MIFGVNTMNRAERRRAKKAGLPVKKEPVVNIKAADVQKIKQDASKEAADKAFLLMLGLPVMVLHDKFGFGPVRCERFTDAVLELYDSFEKGYVSLEDIHLTLKEETGITIVSDGGGEGSWELNLGRTKKGMLTLRLMKG